ncbi:MAG: hypothetical protein IPK63_16520 [Candidatus Competibacteraceae bacterium]|nr:hypothetical protein [Candidatus Competibacteraceae bacterium]
MRSDATPNPLTMSNWRKIAGATYTLDLRNNIKDTQGNAIDSQWSRSRSTRRAKLLGDRRAPTPVAISPRST